MDLSIRMKLKTKMSMYLYPTATESQSHFAFGKDRISQSFGPLEVKNIFHDFDGIPESAFFIEVDGLAIYYSGDHGNSPGALNSIYPTFRKEYTRK